MNAELQSCRRTQSTRRDGIAPHEGARRTTAASYNWAGPCARPTRTDELMMLEPVRFLRTS